MAHDRPRTRSVRGDDRDDAPSVGRFALWGGVAAGVVLLGFLAWFFSGGFSKPTTGTTDPDAKTRMEKLFQLYRAYATKNRKGPASEQQLKEFYASLPAEERGAFGDNVDALFVNPRDNEKYEVRWGILPVPGGSREAIMWEKTSQNGNRYVGLNLGYVVRMPDEDFNQIKKK